MNTYAKNISEPNFRLLVDGETWKKVTNLHDSGPEDKVYLLNRKKGEIVFGDGVHGEKPPVGSRIKAKYQYGGGDKGNVDKEATITLEWTLESSFTNYALGAVFAPKTAGVIFRTCHALEGTKKWELITDLLEGQLLSIKKLSFMDLVLSVLPWPFHKDLPNTSKYSDESSRKGD